MSVAKDDRLRAVVHVSRADRGAVSRGQNQETTARQILETMHAENGQTR
jgi:hypothetical protein